MDNTYIDFKKNGFDINVNIFNIDYNQQNKLFAIDIYDKAFNNDKAIIDYLIHVIKSDKMIKKDDYSYTCNTISIYNYGYGNLTAFSFKNAFNNVLKDCKNTIKSIDPIDDKIIDYLKIMLDDNQAIKNNKKLLSDIINYYIDKTNNKCNGVNHCISTVIDKIITADILIYNALIYNDDYKLMLIRYKKFVQSLIDIIILDYDYNCNNDNTYMVYYNIGKFLN